MNKHKKSWFPKKFLIRLTLLNILIVSLFIVLSSWAIYHTACFLVEGMGTMNHWKQRQFNATLFHYLWMFSLIAIIVGSMIHFYFTKKLMKPLRKLIVSTKSMKSGNYPEPLEVTSNDEIGQLIEHFNGLVGQLKSNHEHRQKLVTDLSHELRTPLTNLNGYLNALKNGVIVGDEKLYHSLYKESERLTKMVTQLEALKEWDYISEQSYVEKEKIAIDVLIKESIKMFYWQLQDRNISVNVQVEHVEINIYKEGMSQAISNLLDNAIRYYEGRGPITIIGKRVRSEYHVSISGPSQEISPENEEKIFERFYRLDASRNRKTGGTGLGLSITKEIIEQHHGKIACKANEDTNTFWFRIPF